MPFADFTPFRVTAGGVDIHGVKGGNGPPLLLLHGHPQSHLIWHRCAAQLAEHFTVIATDLRGYGASAKPPSDETHAPYSKRAMAADQVAVMRHFGFERFLVCAHDRGARARLTGRDPRRGGGGRGAASSARRDCHRAGREARDRLGQRRHGRGTCRSSFPESGRCAVIPRKRDFDGGFGEIASFAGPDGFAPKRSPISLDS